MITFLPFGLVLWGVYMACWVVRAAVKRWRFEWRAMCAHQALFLYALWMVRVALFPIPMHGVPSWPEIDLSPWETLKSALNVRTGVWQLFARSILQFVPLGAALPALYASMRRLSLLLMVSFFAGSFLQVAGLIISARIGIPYRLFEVDDILFNCVGAAIGFGLWRAWSFIRVSRPASATLKGTGDMPRGERGTWILDSKAKSP
ncbi:VanZ family protein [Alicyclobacillus sendaiensis]|uniref:VanZ family protein n=1 Tax=Alicyclobacillus sendaiensis TaxID=192387 RepID=UPI00078209E2|nr:VanZ family protein [Alicyclobacillus sendaiensis]